MKISIAIGLLGLMFLNIYCLKAQTDDSYLSLKEAKKIKNKDDITKIELGKEVLKRKTIPSFIRKFINLENLSLQPKMKSWGMPVDENHHLFSKVPLINKIPFISRFHLFNKIHLFAKK